MASMKLKTARNGHLQQKTQSLWQRLKVVPEKRCTRCQQPYQQSDVRENQRTAGAKTNSHAAPAYHKNVITGVS